ncbi:MAG TPA: FkbM family methyltransferase [Oxalobacteraceae bacterium]|nr:FkbM family methyltransferase [Oxalobacteraceae bacterium]
MLNYKEIISNYSLDVAEDIRCLAQSLISKNKSQGCYFFGRNDLSAQLNKIITADGFIDDYAPPGSTWHGCPVFSLNEINRDAVVVNCVINSRPRTALERIKQAGCVRILSYSDLCRALPDLVPLPDFVADTRKDIVARPDKWRSVYERLSDGESKKVFDDVLHYRLTADLNVLARYTYRPQEQYFEDFMKFDQEVFVDAGGFNGDTTEQFCLRYPSYQKVYLFEPSAKNISLAKKRLATFHSIDFIEKGVSNEPGILYFNSDAGSASAVSTSGKDKIEVTTIDESLTEKVTFIKMDLEGWEINALEGAKGHIFRDHPKLAIAVYHRPSDIWQIPDLVTGIRSDYQVFLRHYTESWTETVMSFVPMDAADRDE